MLPDYAKLKNSSCIVVLVVVVVVVVVALKAVLPDMGFLLPLATFLAVLAAYLANHNDNEKMKQHIVMIALR